MSLMKNYLMTMQDYAWVLIYSAEQDHMETFSQARDKFLAKYPGNEHIFDTVLVEYEDLHYPADEEFYPRLTVTFNPLKEW